MVVQSVLNKNCFSESYALIKILTFYNIVSNTEPDEPLNYEHIHNVENDEDKIITAVTLLQTRTLT